MMVCRDQNRPPIFRGDATAENCIAFSKIAHFFGTGIAASGVTAV
jgi:hypothetical protein